MGLPEGFEVRIAGNEVIGGHQGQRVLQGGGDQDAIEGVLVDRGKQATVACDAKEDGQLSDTASGTHFLKSRSWFQRQS